MSNGDLTADVTTSIVETEEEAFVPGQKKINVVLQPVPEEEVYYPATSPYEELPEISTLPFLTTSSTYKPLLIDIETTGLYPWDSRLICIVARGIEADDKPVAFYNNDEKIMIEQFINFFKTGGYTEIIGYNVSFDIRYIFVKCMRYLIKCSEFANADIYDLMQVMEQVKAAFVYGYNKSGSLDDWAAFLWNEHKTLTYEEILKAWEDKRIDDIIDYCVNDVNLEYRLLQTINYVKEVEAVG